MPLTKPVSSSISKSYFVTVSSVELQAIYYFSQTNQRAHRAPLRIPSIATRFLLWRSVVAARKNRRKLQRSSSKISPRQWIDVRNSIDVVTKKFDAINCRLALSPEKYPLRRP